MNPNVLRTLADKIEQAEEGSERLDKDTARALGFRIAATTSGPHIMHKHDNMASWDLPKYTRSLDAANTLRREGWFWEVHGWRDCHHGYDVSNAILKSIQPNVNRFFADVHGKHAEARARTVAALRGMAEEMKND